MGDSGGWTSTKTKTRTRTKTGSGSKKEPSSKTVSEGGASSRGGTGDRDAIYYFEARGTEYLESSHDDPQPPARTERVLVYATYRRRRSAHTEQDITFTPWAFPGYDARGIAYNAIVWGLEEALEERGDTARHTIGGTDAPPARNMKMLSQRLAPAEVKNGSIANVAPPQLHGVETLGRWRWELYDVDVQPPSWKYGHATTAEFPFGLSAIDVEMIELLQEKADEHAYAEASDVRLHDGDDRRVSRSWFGPADDAIVVAFASKNTRPTTAARLLRINKDKLPRVGPTDDDPVGGAGMLYNEDTRKRQLTANHDPVGPPKDPPDQKGTDALDVMGAQRRIDGLDFADPAHKAAARGE